MVHRDLLATFEEFRASLESPAREVDPEGLRGAVAFLRHSLVPFAHEEEQALAPGEERETASFEHAFLAVETEALSREVAALLALPPGEEARREEAAERVRGRTHRIQAVLELHVFRGEERGITAPPPAAAPGAAPRDMTPEEVRAFLREREWGMLCTVDAGHEPYAVPVSYGLDGGEVYFATGPGRKASNLEESRRVCLTVAEVADGDRWRSVVVRGEAEWVEGIGARLAALRALQRQRSGAPSLADAARFARARVARIVPREVTGRIRG